MRALFAEDAAGRRGPLPPPERLDVPCRCCVSRFIRPCPLFAGGRLLGGPLVLRLRSRALCLSRSRSRSRGPFPVGVECFFLWFFCLPSFPSAASGSS